MRIGLRSGSRWALCALLFSGIWAVALYLCSPQMASAQNPDARAGRSFSLRVNVDLVTTEVIVLDKKGKPVHNLKKENFRIFEDGKQQEILSFDEVASASPLPNLENDDDIKGKIVLIVFDDSTITPPNLKLTRDSAAKFVKAHMRPQDLFAVASFSISFKILQNLTRDRDSILDAIDRPAVSSASAPITQDISPGPPRRSQPFPGDQGMTGGNNMQAENLLRALNAVNLSIEHLKGQKSVLLFSQSRYYSTDPNTYTTTLNSSKRANVVFYSIDPGGLNSGALRQPAVDRQTLSASNARSSLPRRNFLVNSMFQQGGGGQGGTGGGSGSSGGGSGSGGTGGTGGGSSGSGAGSAGGTGRGATGGSSSGGMNTGPSTGRSPGGTYPGNNPGNSPFGNSPFDSSIGNLSSQQSLIRSLAYETGGRAIYNTNDYDGELDKLDDQLSNYYILGFQSNNPKHDGAFRKLEIKAELKGLTLRYRKGYLDRRPLDVLANSRQEKSLLGAMASPETAVQLPLMFRPVYFYDSPKLARVLVVAKMRLEKLELKKKGGQLASDVNVMGAAYGEDGSVAARFSETLHLSVDKEKEQDFRKGNLSYRNYFRLRPGKYRLKMAASDEASHLGSSEQFIEIPGLPDKGLAASSMVIADQMTRLPDLIRNLQTRLLDDSDPLIYAGLQISPSVENRLKIQAPFRVFFKLYNSSGPASSWKLGANVKLVGPKGEALNLSSVPLDDLLLRTGSTEAIVGLNLPSEKIDPGKYRLIIETFEAGSTQVATVQTELEFLQ